MDHIIKGMRVRFVRPVEIARITCISQGETGTIDSIYWEDEGGITLIYVKLDKYHHGLEEWDNCVIMSNRFSDLWDDECPSIRVNCEFL